MWIDVNSNNFYNSRHFVRNTMQLPWYPCHFWQFDQDTWQLPPGHGNELSKQRQNFQLPPGALKTSAGFHHDQNIDGVWTCLNIGYPKIPQLLTLMYEIEVTITEIAILIHFGVFLPSFLSRLDTNSSTSAAHEPRPSSPCESLPTESQAHHSPPGAPDHWQLLGIYRKHIWGGSYRGTPKHSKSDHFFVVLKPVVLGTPILGNPILPSFEAQNMWQSISPTTQQPVDPLDFGLASPNPNRESKQTPPWRNRQIRLTMGLFDCSFCTLSNFFIISLKTGQQAGWAWMFLWYDDVKLDALHNCIKNCRLFEVRMSSMAQYWRLMLDVVTSCEHWVSIFNHEQIDTTVQHRIVQDKLKEIDWNCAFTTSRHARLQGFLFCSFNFAS